MKKTRLNVFLEGCRGAVVALLLTFVMSFCWHGSLHAQERGTDTTPKERVTIEFEDATLERVLSYLKEEANYYVFYNSDLVRGIRVTIDLRNATIDQIMDECLENTHLEYTINDGTIIIRSKQESASKERASSTSSIISITGTVTDRVDRKPLAGISVNVKGTTIGTITDSRGGYRIQGRWIVGDTIVYTCLGKEPVSIKYVGQEEQNVVMRDASERIGEVVVSPKQNINELDIRARTGVIDEVNMYSLSSKPVFDVSLALQGSVPGLSVINKGDLGTRPEIRIRGTSSFRGENEANEPLYIMDGQVISPDAFMTLNPMDIEEIKVLKDAVACALYGIKAANGVLEITSKRGTPDGQMVVNYDFNVGVTTRGRRGVDMMNSAEKLELERRIKNVSAPGYRYSEEYYLKHYPTSPDLDEMIAYGAGVLDSLRSINTDWFDELIRNSVYHRHNLSLRGGTEKTSYYASVNYAMQGGRIPGNDVHRFGANMSVDQRIKNLGFLSLSASAGHSKVNTPNGSSFSPTSLVFDLNPYETKQTENLISFPGRGYRDLVNQYSSKSTDKRGGLTGSINLEPFKGFVIDAVAGVDFVLSESMNFTPSTSYSEQTSGAPEVERGSLSKAKNTNTNLSTNTRLTYNVVLNDKHDITIGANMDYYKTDVDNVSILGYGVGTNAFAAAINQSITGGRRARVGSTVEKIAQLGVGGVLGYTFDNTYDFLFTYKTDASSVLPSDKRWNDAWAVGVGWSIHQYPFLRESKVLTQLNVRGSYGKIANLAGVSPASTIGTFSYSESYYGNQRLLELISLYNVDLKPEQTTSIDLGLSFELFNRFSFGVNFYHRETSDALLDVPIPSSNGFMILKRNIGVLRNEGVELTASMRLIDSGDWRFMLQGSLSYNRNKVVDLYYGDRIYLSDDILTPEYEVGKSYDILYGLHSMGINPHNGLPMFKGGDGREVSPLEELERDDVVVLGRSTPPYNGTINVGLSYKNFDLNMDFYYVFGGKQVYNEQYIRTYDDVHRNAGSAQLNNMWFKKGDENKRYYTPNYSSTAQAMLNFPNTRTIGRSDYIKLSMLSLRYVVPQTFLRKNCGFIKYANISFQGSNLFMLTPYKESDPESGSLIGTQQPVFTINVSVTF